VRPAGALLQQVRFAVSVCEVTCGACACQAARGRSSADSRGALTPPAPPPKAHPGTTSAVGPVGTGGLMPSGHVLELREAGAGAGS
jgi:hypothetical protein